MKEGSSNSKLLAVWWYAGGSFFGKEEPLDGSHVVQRGDFLDLDFTHFETWDEFNPAGVGAEYDDFPRGRILYKIPIHQFVVYTSSELVTDESFRSDIRLFYGLPQTTIFESDEHYDGVRP